MSDFERAIVELQQMADQRAREDYGDSVFHHWRHTPYRGRPERFSAESRVTGDCGDTVAIYLVVNNDQVQDCRFESDGCGPSQACAAVACLLAVGSSVEEAASIPVDAVLERLPDLPEDHEHCANLAVKAIEAAVHDLMTRRS